MEIWGKTALHQAVLRNNSLEMIELLIDYGADPALPNREGKSAIMIAARRGRANALDLFEKRGTPINLAGIDALLAACARNQQGAIKSLTDATPGLRLQLIEQGGTLLAEFAGAGNLAGVRDLLHLGVDVNAIYLEGDAYYDIARNSSALHVAAWRARPEIVKELIARGAWIDAFDAQNRTALQLAVKACIDSYWTDRRSPDSVRLLLEAGASTEEIQLPTGYDEIDVLLRRGASRQR